MNKIRLVIAASRHSGIMLAVVALLQGFLQIERLALAFGRTIMAPPIVGHAITDATLFFRTSGAASLTQTETATAIAINGTPAIGLALVVDVPKKSVGDTMQVLLDHSTDNSTFTNLLSFETVASVTAASTVPFKLVRRFHTRLKYIQTRIIVAGTSPDFGVVVVRVTDSDQWNVLGVGQNAGSTP